MRKRNKLAPFLTDDELGMVTWIVLCLFGVAAVYVALVVGL